MSTFQEMIYVSNDTHVTKAIHEKACVISYGTDLTDINHWDKPNSVCSDT